ncbi:MAG: ABC transporter permease [Polyangiaceae bacterium]|nr:ABC transporter permease [Polyangiaceae bacterium]
MTPRARARLARSPSAIAGAAAIGALVAFCVVGPAFAPHGPFESDFVRGVGPDLRPVGPCRAFPLGADHLFRDVLARVAYAGRLSLTISVAATAIAAAVGSAVGILAGWYEGRGAKVPWGVLAGGLGALTALGSGHVIVAAVAAVAGGLAAGVTGARGPRVDVDGWLMRCVDVLLAFPFLLLVMALGAALERTSAVTIFVTLGATGWLGIARVLRAKTMQVRALEFVEASRALGQSTPRVLLRHVVPHVAGPLVVSATVLVAQMIVAESTLSYLGVGLSPPTPTWGRMLYEGQDDLVTAPWLLASPAAVIVVAVWAFNMLGEGLRDALDPTGARMQ